MKNFTTIGMLLLMFLASSMAFGQSANALSAEEQQHILAMEQMAPGQHGPSVDIPNTRESRATPVTTFPFDADFEDGSTPDEITPVVGSNAIYDISPDAAFNSSFGQRHQGNTSSGWSNNTNPADNFLDNPTHIISAQTQIIPSGGAGILKAKFMLKQTYTYNNQYYSNFRVTVNGTPVASEEGWTYRNGTDPSAESFIEVEYDLSPWQNDPDILLALESANKYYAGYTSSYPWGDCSYIDNFQIYYELPPGDVEGYVYNSAGQTVSGATVETEGVAPATTDGSGYYLLTGVRAGDVEISASKTGFNTITDLVTVVTGSLVAHDFTLTAPNLNITPLIFNETLNPNEYLTTYLSLLNTGDGPLDWTAWVEYPDNSPASYPAYDNSEYDITYGQLKDANAITRRGANDVVNSINGSRAVGDVILQFTVPSLTMTWGAGFDGDYLYITDPQSFATTIFQLNPDGTPTGNDFTVSVGQTWIGDMASDGDYLYALMVGGPNNIQVIDIATGNVVNTIGNSAWTGTSQRGLAYDAVNDEFYVGGWNSNIIYRISSTGAVISQTPFAGVSGLEWHPQGGPNGDGSLWVITNADPSVCTEVDPNNGWASLQNFQQPGNNAFGGAGLALNSDGNLWMPNMNELTVYLVDTEEPLSGGGATGWLTLSDYDGSVAPNGGTFNIGTNFDATGTVAGEVYYAEIKLNTSPNVGQITIPATMTIAGDELPEISGFTAELTNDVTGQVTLMWNAFREVTFEYYLIKRNGQVITTTTNSTYVDMLPGFGTYDYTVQPVFVQGQGAPAGPETVEWYEPALCMDGFAENTQWTDTEQEVVIELENCSDNGVLAFEFPDYLDNGRDLTCDYTVMMYDSWGDGWNGNSLDLYLDGVYAGTAELLSGTEGSFTFEVYNGAEITGIWNYGSFVSECSYDITDCDGDIVYSGVAGDIPAGALYAVVPAEFVINVEPASGTINAGQTLEVVLTYSSMGYPEGDYMQEIFVVTNEPDVPGREQTHGIINTMHVIEPASISGMVTDCNTGAPMANVTLTAVTVGGGKDLEDTFTAETGEDGNYMMYVNADTDYELTASKAGFASQMENVSVVMSAVVDFELCEEPYPVTQVWADPNEADTECLVTWTLPMGPYLIAYDDGSAEDYFAWTGAGGASAVKFTPAGYPATVEGGLIYVGDGSFPVGGNFLGTQMAVGVLDDDGAGGMPGTVMDSAVVTVNNYGWVNLDGMFNVTLDDGNFYLVMWQLGLSPNAAPVGVDLEVPTVYRSYVKANNGEWMVSVYNDFMIRAIVSGPGENVVSMGAGQMVYPGKLHPDTYIAMGTPSGVAGMEGTGEFKPVIVENAERDLVSYQLYRISGIDPENGVDIEDGVQTLIQPSLTAQQYNDVAWGGLDPGFYAYAVTATYENGDVSDMVYSNIAAHGLDNMVTLNISQCDDNSPEGAYVMLSGRNWPNQVLTATVDADGIVVFDSVIDGYYDLMVTKDGYMDYAHNNIYLFDDYEETIVLQENTYPARELVVDPMTSVATWKIPYATLVENQGFDAGTDFPPADWSETTQGDGWFHTDNGGSSFFPIPAGDGWYACVNDDANSGNNGCCDYLILPELDLSNTTSLLLQFDAYFTAAYGQSASVEYSLDGGASWAIVYDLPGAEVWTTYQVDLEALGGNESVLIAFHSNDNGAWASGVAIDNVSAFYGKEPVGYYVYLDGGFIAETASDVLTYTYQNLTYGQTYEAAVRALYSCGLSEPITYTFTSNFLYPPRNLGDEYVYGTNEVPLMWNPPMTVAGPAIELPNVENDAVIGTTNHSLGAVPAGSQSTEETPASVYLDITRDGENIAWVTAPQGGTPSNFYTMDMATYGTSLIGASAVDPASGDFMNGDADNLYVAANWGADLYSIDVATGTATMIAPFSGAGAMGVNGMACDRTTNTMYVGMTDASLTSSQIGTLDVTTGVITPIGSTNTVAPGLIDIAIDGAGQMYGWCLVTDASYMIDKATGDVVSLGSLGFDANFGQGGNYNADDGIIYLTAFNNTAFAGELRALDPATGGTTFLAALPELQMTAFGVPSTGGGSTGGGIPDGLMSFNVYRDGGEDPIANVPYDGEGVDEWLYYVDNNMEPGCYDYTVTAMYDLGEYGFPGETAESDIEGPWEVCVVWGFELPFCETWDQGTFGFNNWATNENWVISSQEGNPAPAAMFNWDPLLEDGYTSALTSAPFNADMLTEGTIWLDYEVALDDRNGTGDEMLYVEINNGSGWEVIDEFANDGSFDFMGRHIDVTDYASGTFKVRFNAMGENSFDIISWYVDNVCVYRTCEAPYNLTADWTWTSEEDYGIDVCWEAEVGSGGGSGEWLSYGDGPYVAGIGLNPIGPITVAVEFDQDDLADYDGMEFSKMNFRYGNALLLGDVLVQIWENEVLILEETATGIEVNAWNEVTYNAPVVIDASKSYRIGYTVTDWDWNPDGPMGAQDFTGSLKSDLVLLNGVWDNLSNYLPNSWLLEAFVSEAVTNAPVEHIQLVSAVESTATAENLVAVTAAPVDNNVRKTANRALTQFKVYRSMDAMGEYTMVGTVDAEPGVSEYCYTDSEVTDQQLYCYKVMAVYMGEDDMCESGFATSMANPLEDYVCQMAYVGVGDPLEASTILYPNPASSFVKIVSGQDITEIKVINYVGQMVYDSKTQGGQSVLLNTGSYEPGVYVVRINTTHGVVTKRMVIAR